MKKFKKLFLACASFCVCFSLLGCSAQTSVAADINNKLYRVENIINSIEKISDNDLSFLDSDTIEVGAFFPGQVPYGNYMYNGLGYYCHGNNCYTGYNGYNFRPYYNGMNNGYYNNINNPYYNNAWMNNGFFFGSNIDTYRPINKIYPAEENHNYTKDIKTSTNNSGFDKINLTSSAKTCSECNNYTNMLIDNIKHHISNCYDLAHQIETGEITLSNAQIESVNELLKNMISTCSKINMAKSELNNILANVIASKTTMAENYTGLNSKYIRLLGCMDTRNSYLQTILNSLLQLECSITGQYNVNYQYGEENSDTDSNNVNPTPINQNINCEDCNNHTSENCENCVNITNNNDENCENCNLITRHEEDCQNCNDCEGNTCIGGNDCINGICQGDDCICAEETEDLDLEHTSLIDKKNTTPEVVNNDELIKDKLLNDGNNALVVEPDDIDPNYQIPIDYDDELTTLEYIHPNTVNSIYNENDQENNKSLTA